MSRTLAVLGRLALRRRLGLHERHEGRAMRRRACASRADPAAQITGPASSGDRPLLGPGIGIAPAP
ncbi:MAG TPA: hypothetical protein VGE10_07055, partial [Zeimonas sp.]